MQNRIDELFAAARNEQLFYEYTEAEALVRKLPASHSAGFKITLKLIAALIIACAGLWWMNMESSQEIPVAQHVAPSVKDSGHEVTLGFGQEGGPENDSKNQIWKQSLMLAENDSTEDFRFNDPSPAAPQFEEKSLPKEEYIVLMEDQMKKLGVEMKSTEYLRYIPKNGKRRSGIEFEIKLGPKGQMRHLTVQDSLSESDIPGKPVFTALFIEILTEEAEHQKEGRSHLVIPKRTLISSDALLPSKYEETAFQHYKGRMLPVLTELNDRDKTYTIILYYPPTEQIKNALPADTKQQWLQMENFDWTEYARYRQMLTQRETDALAEHQRRTSQLKARLSHLKPHTQKEELRKLGLSYSGHSIRLRLKFTVAQSTVFIADMHFTPSGSTISTNEQVKVYDGISPVMMTDSGFINVEIVQQPIKQEKGSIEADRELAIQMADTLVPVLVPLRLNFMDKRMQRKHPEYGTITHKIFWYRRTDLIKAGFKEE